MKCIDSEVGTAPRVRRQVSQLLPPLLHHQPRPRLRARGRWPLQQVVPQRPQGRPGWRRGSIPQRPPLRPPPPQRRPLQRGSHQLAPRPRCHQQSGRRPLLRQPAPRRSPRLYLLQAAPHPWWHVTPHFFQLPLLRQHRRHRVHRRQGGPRPLQRLQFCLATLSRLRPPLRQQVQQRPPQTPLPRLLR